MRIQNPESRINHLIRAYKGLKSLFDPAVEGNPYIRDVRTIKSDEIRKPFFSLRRMSWK